MNINWCDEFLYLSYFLNLGKHKNVNIANFVYYGKTRSPIIKILIQVALCWLVVIYIEGRGGDWFWTTCDIAIKTIESDFEGNNWYLKWVDTESSEIWKRSLFDSSMKKLLNAH